MEHSRILEGTPTICTPYLRAKNARRKMWTKWLSNPSRPSFRVVFIWIYRNSRENINIIVLIYKIWGGLSDNIALLLFTNGEQSLCYLYCRVIKYGRWLTSCNWESSGLNRRKSPLHDGRPINPISWLTESFRPSHAACAYAARLSAGHGLVKNARNTDMVVCSTTDASEICMRFNNSPQEWVRFSCFVMFPHGTEHTS